MNRGSLQPEWQTDLSIQMQSVLMLALRGPDGIPKSHPCKDVQRAYRGTVIIAAERGRLLAFGEEADSFMSMDLFADWSLWKKITNSFFNEVDQLPHHFTMHLLHGAEILGYKHPSQDYRDRWIHFYYEGCRDMHVRPETELRLNLRLDDWEQWRPGE